MKQPFPISKLAVALTAAICCASTIASLPQQHLSAATTKAQISTGDVTGDGVVSGADLAQLRQLIQDNTAPPSDAADIDHNGRLTGTDVALLQAFLLGESTAFPPDTPITTTIPDYGTPMNTNATIVADFRQGETPLFFASDGWTNGNPFDCGWYAENAVIHDGALHLSIDEDSTGTYNYSGGEYRTADTYHYGYYETSMQAIQNPGVVSSFFTYTGPSEDNPWDEIDIEILGKDTTKVQFNYYTNGVGNHEYMYDLGFDASEGYHTYGFDWQPDYIAWYVDGVEVYRATQDIPVTPGRIMMNTWPGIGVNDWLAAYDGTTPLTARYQWVTYTANSGSDEPDTPTTTTIPDYGTPMNTNATIVADFRQGETPLFFASDGWTNGNPFDCGWYAENAVIHDGALHLSIDEDSTGTYNYSGGEYRTADTYHYGYYETSMQAIQNPGVVSSFFTYTGPSEDNPWDEIDIEILGKDTTKVQFNYYTNGVGNHEYMYDLGFDASEGYHTYGFDWQPDYIAWYVDGVEVYRATQDIPVTPGRIMMNTWPGIGVNDWLAAYDGTTPLTARYQWVTYTANSGSDEPDTPTTTTIPDYGTPMNTNATIVADFRQGETPLFFASDGWTNGNPFDCGWYAENAVIHDGALHLSIDEDSTGTYNYSGGEYRTADTYHYGYYETSMQAIQNPGVVSSFFTYTGPSEDNPWDEIDIEILGKDTTKVQFNYYTNGVGNHEYMYDLGFDASEGYHTYGFDWQPNYIAWYVDGVEVYRATQDIPVTPGRIMMNTWPGIGVNDWLAAYDGTTPLTARYQWVTYTAEN